MNKATQKGKEIIREILSHKIRIVVGIVSFLALFVLSIYFLYEGEINKRMMISTFLCLVVGFFIICPRLRDWRISLVTTACYLSVVPGKMFDRIELPVHDLSNLRGGAELANILIILLIFAVLLLIFQRSGLALSVGGV
ncbi:MAG: hypothetical protein LUH58_06310 [Lachnospiraceae bacterium]|nr:hypothetical protein [Lachnospiraceae bacterium]